MNGSNHARVTAVLAAALMCHDPVMAAGAVSGIILSNDLDINTVKYIGTNIIRRIPVIGRLLAFLWRVMWWPYAVKFKHRSTDSHGLVIGTIIRVLYISIFFLVANIWIPMTIPAWLGRAIVGLIMSDCLHTVTDILFRN